MRGYSESLNNLESIVDMMQIDELCDEGILTAVAEGSKNDPDKWYEPLEDALIVPLVEQHENTLDVARDNGLAIASIVSNIGLFPGKVKSRFEEVVESTGEMEYTIYHSFIKTVLKHIKGNESSFKSIFSQNDSSLALLQRNCKDTYATKSKHGIIIYSPSLEQKRKQPILDGSVQVIKFTGKAGKFFTPDILPDYRKICFAWRLKSFDTLVEKIFRKTAEHILLVNYCRDFGYTDTLKKAIIKNDIIAARLILPDPKMITRDNAMAFRNLFYPYACRHGLELSIEPKIDGKSIPNYNGEDYSGFSIDGIGSQIRLYDFEIQLTDSVRYLFTEICGKNSHSKYKHRMRNKLSERFFDTHCVVLLLSNMNKSDATKTKKEMYKKYALVYNYLSNLYGLYAQQIRDYCQKYDHLVMYPVFGLKVASK